jgi:hypothetical protein
LLQNNGEDARLSDPLAPKIVETDASDLGYGGILKQVQDNKEQILQYTSAHWNDSSIYRSSMPSFFIVDIYIYIYVLPKFLSKFWRVFPILGGLKLSTKSYYTSNFNSHSDPIILDLNPTHDY